MEASETDHTLLNASFKRKLFDMLCDPSNERAIAWSKDGLSFQVLDADALEHEVLPKYFRHSRFSSFIRQLNFYNFQKLSRERSHWHYFHTFFQRDRPHLLHSLKRKTHTDFFAMEKEQAPHAQPKQQTRSSRGSHSAPLSAASQANPAPSRTKQCASPSASRSVAHTDEESQCDSLSSPSQLSHTTYCDLDSEDGTLAEHASPLSTRSHTQDGDDKGLSLFLDSFTALSQLPEAGSQGKRLVAKNALLQGLRAFDGLGALCLSHTFLSLCTEVRDWIVRQTTVNKRGKKSLFQRLQSLLSERLRAHRDIDRELQLYAQACVGEYEKSCTCAFFLRFSMNVLADLSEHVVRCVALTANEHTSSDSTCDKEEGYVDVDALVSNLDTTQSVLARFHSSGRCDETPLF